MRLDEILIKEILIWCEENTPSKDSHIPNAYNIELEGYSQDQIIYHVDKLVKAGYIDGKNYTNSLFSVNDLTIEGHQLLKIMRNPDYLPKVFLFLERFGIPSAEELLQLIQIVINKDL